MGHHTFDADGADKLERPERRYRFFSFEELLWALALSPEDTVADLGSGTGFFTDDIAPHPTFSTSSRLTTLFSAER